MDKKLAVLFPGIGYHCDKPLLYYSKKLAKQRGYEVVEIHYDFDGEILDVKNNAHRMIEAVEEFGRQALSQLGDISFDQYESVVFVGKSIGTAIAARLARGKELTVKQVVLTPVPDTLQNLPKENTIVFHGLSDPWCDNDIVDKAKEETGFELHLIENANHSLETGDAMTDLEIVRNVVEKITPFFN